MEIKVTVKYNLNAVGRKASLLEGGRGAKTQYITMPGSADSLRYADVDTMSAKLFVPTLKSNELLNRQAWISTPGYNGRDYGTLSVPYQYIEKPDWSPLYESDHVLSVDEVNAYLAALPAKIAALEAKIVTTHKRAQAQLEAEFPAFLAAAEKKHADWLAEAEAQKRAEAEAEKKHAAAEAARAAEMAAWIAEHGSERLKLAHQGGYKLDKIYLAERVALELGEGWLVDTGDRAAFEDRASPSLEALKIVEALPEGFVGEVVWMTAPPDDSYLEPCEAVLVSAPFTVKSIYKMM